jgi:hypothetical protein
MRIFSPDSAAAREVTLAAMLDLSYAIALPFQGRARKGVAAGVAGLTARIWGPASG